MHCIWTRLERERAESWNERSVLSAGGPVWRKNVAQQFLEQLKSEVLRWASSKGKRASAGA